MERHELRYHVLDTLNSLAMAQRTEPLFKRLRHGINTLTIEAVDQVCRDLVDRGYVENLQKNPTKAAVWKVTAAGRDQVTMECDRLDSAIHGDIALG